MTANRTSHPIGVAALSRDGSHVAAAVGRSVCLWETATGKRLHEIEAPKPFILLAFSPDGGSLAGVDIDMAVTVWNVASGRGETRLPARVSGPEAEFSRSPQQFVQAWRPFRPTCSISPGIHLDVKAMRGWLRFTAIATGKEPRGNPFLNELPPALAFSPDGRSLIWAGNDQNVHVTEIATGRETLRTEKAGLNGPICRPDPVADGKTLAVARMVFDKPEIRVELWGLSDGEAPGMRSSRPTSPELGLVQRFGGLHRGWARSLAGARAFSPDGTTLAVEPGRRADRRPAVRRGNGPGGPEPGRGPPGGGRGPGRGTRR